MDQFEEFHAMDLVRMSHGYRATISRLFGFEWGAYVVTVLFRQWLWCFSLGRRTRSLCGAYFFWGFHWELRFIQQFYASVNELLPNYLAGGLIWLQWDPGLYTSWRGAIFLRLICYLYRFIIFRFYCGVQVFLCPMHWGQCIPSAWVLLLVTVSSLFV